jgi:integrase
MRPSSGPCRIKGRWDRVKSAEQSVATPAEVTALIEAITPRYRAAVALTAWCGLRRGEIWGLHANNVDLAAGTVWVERAWAELLESGVKFEKDPKSRRASGRFRSRLTFCRSSPSTSRSGPVKLAW